MPYRPGRRIASSYDVLIGSSHGRDWLVCTDPSPLEGEHQFMCRISPEAKPVPAGKDPADLVQDAVDNGTSCWFIRMLLESPPIIENDLDEVDGDDIIAMPIGVRAFAAAILAQIFDDAEPGWIDGRCGVKSISRIAKAFPLVSEPAIWCIYD